MPMPTPLHQPPIESLRNALQIAWAWRDRDQGLYTAGRDIHPFNDIARLIKDALDKLSEPHPATVRVVKNWVPVVVEREAYDCAAAVTRTALDWETR